MSVKVNVDDRVMKALAKKLGALAAKTVRVGVLSSEGASNSHDSHKGQTGGPGSEDFSMIELAAVHELGSPAAGIPERSFIRATFEDPETIADQKKVSEKLARRIVFGKLQIDEALGILGLWGVSKVKNAISEKKIKQGLSPDTVAKKKSTTALVDTGRLINAINHVVD